MADITNLSWHPFPLNQASASGLPSTQHSRQPLPLMVVVAPNEIRFFIQSREGVIISMITNHEFESSPWLPTMSLNFTSRDELHKLKVPVGILFQPSICRRTHPRENRSLLANKLGFLHTRLETPCGQKLCSPRAQGNIQLTAGAELNNRLN